MTTLNKIILKTAVAGLIWTVVIFSYGLGIFAMCFPHAMAEFYDTVGNASLSAIYRERIYQRDPTDKNLYYALDKFILAENYDKIVEYSEKLFARPKYNKLIDDINEFKEKRAGSDQLLLALACNEDNRLRCAYIKALLEKGKSVNRAFAEAIFYENDSVTYSDINLFLSRPSYAILEFSDPDETMLEKFSEYYQAYKDACDIVYSDINDAPIKIKYFYNDEFNLFAELLID